MMFPKHKTYRDEPLRRAVASLPCVCCGRVGATQAAHMNRGKGMGIKASDALCAALCVTCHSELDQGGRMTRDERRAFENEMVAKTYQALVEAGLLKVAA